MYAKTSTNQHCVRCGEENLTNDDIEENNTLCKYCFEKQVEFYMEQFQIEEENQNI